MVYHHHAFRPRKGIFHRREPTTQRRELLFGKFVLGRGGVSPRRNTPHRQWERHNIGLLEHFVPFAPDNLAASWTAVVPAFPARTRVRLYRLARHGNRGTQQSQPFADYLSIGDRYSAQTNFDSKNTIGGRLRVNRAHKRCAVFLSTVIKQQQWQIGDSLLNSKFGRPTRPRKDVPDRLGLPTFLLPPLWGAPHEPDLSSPKASRTAAKLSARSALSPNLPA
jgi:hypothetical protein